MSTVSVRAQQYVQYKLAKNQATLRGILIRLLDQIFFIEGKKGKGKTIATVAICHDLREMFGKPVIIVGTKMGLTEKFGPFTFLSEKQFIAELDKIAKISKSTPDGEAESAIVTALKAMGVLIMNATIIFDEAYKLFESRGGGADKLVRLFGYFVAQSRHYHLTIGVIAPHRDMVDKRVRRQIDFYGRASTTCKSIPDPQTGRPVCVRWKCPHTTIVRFRGGATRFKLKVWGPSYWDKFDTWALVGFREKSLQIETV